MQIMGILNVTPDSFSDGGKHTSIKKAIEYARQMVFDGADIIDIGGESSRPGADEVSIQEELDRVIPVIEGIRANDKKIKISIDTKKYEVAQAAALSGVNIINDISGLAFNENIADIVAKNDLELVLMHMRGNSKTMQSANNLKYDNLIEDICNSLNKSATCAINRGVKRDNIIIDPGIGFSKNTSQNIEILAQIAKFQKMKYRVLIGHSNKKFIGEILNKDKPNDRNNGTIGVAMWLATQNIDIIRVHNVKEVNEALTMFETIRGKK